eukprot:5128341-Amphidinium_carterae.2
MRVCIRVGLTAERWQCGVQSSGRAQVAQRIIDEKLPEMRDCVHSTETWPHVTRFQHKPSSHSKSLHSRVAICGALVRT